jgi:hypothetical protein
MRCQPHGAFECFVGYVVISMAAWSCLYMITEGHEQ